MKSPAFQFYPQDFVSSLDVQIMTVEQIGGYILLLINSWIQDKQGYLPDNDMILQRICRMNNKQWSKNRDIILKKFRKADGYLYNQRLILELQKQHEYREKQAQNGQKGGRPKKNENPEKPTAFSGETQTEAKKSSSSSFSSSSSNTTNTDTTNSKASGEKNRCPISRVVLPFQSQKFKDVWSVWLKHLKEKNVTVSSVSAHLSLNELKDLSDNKEEEAVNIIKFSIKKNWCDLYKPKYEDREADFKPMQPTKTTGSTKALFDIEDPPMMKAV